MDDSIEKVLDDIAKMFERKNEDYTDISEQWYSTFIRSGDHIGVSPHMAAELLIAVKQARLRSLLTSGDEPNTDSIEDSLLDRAVYSVIALAIYRETKIDEDNPFND